MISGPLRERGVGLEVSEGRKSEKILKKEAKMAFFDDFLLDQWGVSALYYLLIFILIGMFIV